MFLHQISNTVGDTIVNAYLYDGWSWVQHMHKAFEFSFVLDGSIEATAGDRQYTLGAGDGLLALPFQLHALRIPAGARVLVVVFSASHVPAFAACTDGKMADNAFVRLSDAAAQYFVASFFGRTVPASLPPEQYLAVPIPHPLRLKACLYAVCAEFAESAHFSPRTGDTELTRRILDYIETNYRENISLKTMATTLGYAYHYLSRVFGETFGMHFNTLLNQYRCDRADALIAQGAGTLAEIAMESGFQSIRTFNRVYRSICGRAPSRRGG